MPIKSTVKVEQKITEKNAFWRELFLYHTFYKIKLGEYKKDKQSVEELREDLDNIQNKIFEAKIINHSPWNDYNEIRFKLISTAIDKTYNTKEHEIIREFFLKKC